MTEITTQTEPDLDISTPYTANIRSTEEFLEAMDFTNRSEQGIRLFENLLVKMLIEGGRFDPDDFNNLYGLLEDHEVQHIKNQYYLNKELGHSGNLPSAIFRSLSPQIAHFIDNGGKPDALEYVYYPDVIFERAGDPNSVEASLAWKIFTFSEIAQETRARLDIVTTNIREKVKEIEGSSEKEVRLLLIAGGLAPAVFKLAKEFPNIKFKIDLIDIDRKVLTKVNMIANQLKNLCIIGHLGDVTTENFVRKGKPLPIDDDGYDVVEAVGINDYFSVEQMSILLINAYRKVKSGGRIIIGNVALTNPKDATRIFLHSIVGWPDMQHKDKEETTRVIKSVLPTQNIKIIPTPESTILIPVIDVEKKQLEQIPA